MSAPEISVLIVNWNGCADLRQCLQSLRAQTARDFEIVVVDNGSADDSVAMLRAEFPEVRCVETEQNLGFAEGCNRGLQVIQAPWVLTLNNDTRAEVEFIAALADAARTAAADVGMLAAHLLFMDRPHLTNSTGVRMFDNGSFVDRGFAEPAAAHQAELEIFCPSAGAALYRRSMLDAVRLSSGVFDQTFFMYFEDVDLGWRCRLAGWRALYVPAARVYHRFQASSSRQKGHFVKIHSSCNRLRTVLKNASLRHLVRVFPHLFIETAFLLREEGPQLWPKVLNAVADGLKQRRTVSAITQQPRRRVEAQFVEIAEKRWLKKLTL